MSKVYKTYTKEKWLYFGAAIVAYFLPFVIVSACMLPYIKVATGFKVAIGLGIVVINTIPFLMGICRAFLAHFPMFNMLAVVFIALAAFFRLDVFKNYCDKFLWIELAAAVGSIVSCVLWWKHSKYSAYHNTMKATINSGAFDIKEGDSDQGK